jgi:hypothetical protein
MNYCVERRQPITVSMNLGVFLLMLSYGKFDASTWS